MRIAVPITASNMNDALKDIREASELGDIVELRIDYMERPDLDLLLAACRIPAIVTNRAKDEGGSFGGTEEERISYLKKAIDLGAAYVDIEFRHYVELDKKKTKLIVSYHNFEQTPANLEDIYQRIVETNADIVKICTKANTEEDVHRITQLLEHSRVEMIGTCIGELGKRTRLHPKNYLTFASLTREKSSAPCQYTVAEIREALKATSKV